MNQPSATPSAPRDPASTPAKSALAAHPITSAAIVVLVAGSTSAARSYVPIYAHVTPKIGDFPFFYFYLLAFMPVPRSRSGSPPCCSAAGGARGSRRQRRGGDAMSNVNAAMFTIVLVLFVIVTGVGFAAARWRRPEDMHAPGRVGPRRARLRHVHHVVPARRRPVHRLHVHRGARAGVRLGLDRLLRGLLHDHGVPDRVHLPAAAVVGLPGARLRHAGRLHPRPVRLARPGARRRPSPASWR